MEPYSIYNTYHFYQTISLLVRVKTALRLKSFVLRAMRLLVNLVLIAITGNQKRVAMSLALYIKRVCLLLGMYINI